MTSKLTVFTYEKQEVRNVIINDEPWFVLADVCKVLELGTPSKVANRLDNDEKGVTLIHTLGGNQKVIIINESGLYAVILRSDKPQAKPFRKWVTSEVLPSIRRTGAYARNDVGTKFVPTYGEVPNDYKVRNLAVKEMNARSRQAQTLVRLAQLTQNVTCREALIAQAANTASGKELLQLPKLAARTYKAEEIGERLGVSRQKIGRLSNIHNLKTDEYGGWFAEFVPVRGEVQTFRYYENAVDKFRELLNAEAAV